MYTPELISLTDVNEPSYPRFMAVFRSRLSQVLPSFHGRIQNYRRIPIYRRIQIYGRIQDRLSQVQISTILRVHGSNSLIILSDPALGSSSFSLLADVCRTLGGPCRTPGFQSTTTARRSSEGASPWLICPLIDRRKNMLLVPTIQPTQFYQSDYTNT